MSEADIAAARAKIESYLKESLEHGIALRPINGQAMRLASRVGLDLDALGRADDEAQSDEDYFDQCTVAFWLLGAPLDEVLASIDVEPEGVRLAACGWSMRHLPSLAHERAALRAFVARWLEYRVEMQILQQVQPCS